MTERVLSSNEAARALGVSDRTIRYWAKAGAIVPAYITQKGRVAFRRAEVDRLKRERAAAQRRAA